MTEKAQHQARLSDIEKVLEQLTENLDSKRETAEQLKIRIDSDSERLAHSKEARSALGGELTILTDMENRHEGLNNAVKAILAKRSNEDGQFGYVEDIVADVIEADIDYAAAVEAALEGRTDALIVNSAERLLADREAMEKLDGRVSFLCSESAAYITGETVHINGGMHMA